jgi:hypothetical protein
MQNVAGDSFKKKTIWSLIYRVGLHITLNFPKLVKLPSKVVLKKS